MFKETPSLLKACLTPLSVTGGFFSKRMLKHYLAIFNAEENLLMCVTVINNRVIDLRFKVDPVCGMQVDPVKAVYKTIYKGEVYYFCSKRCKNSFEKDPEYYLKHGSIGMPQ